MLLARSMSRSSLQPSESFSISISASTFLRTAAKSGALRFRQREHRIAFLVLRFATVSTSTSSFAVCLQWAKDALAAVELAEAIA